MIMGYFDESTESNQEFTCMAGYLADDANWNALTSEWDVLLKKYSIPYLHLSDFMHSWKIYEALGWKQYPNRQERVKEALGNMFMDIVCSHCGSDKVIRAGACGVCTECGTSQGCS